MRPRPTSGRRAGSSGGCRQDIAYRVITGNQVPDHATIARFIVHHQQSRNALFGSVLQLCARDDNDGVDWRDSPESGGRSTTPLASAAFDAEGKDCSDAGAGLNAGMEDACRCRRVPDPEPARPRNS